VSVERRRSLSARWLLVSVAFVSVVFAIGACSSGTDTSPDVDGTVAANAPSSTRVPPGDRQSHRPTPAAYQASVHRIGAELRSRMRFSHHAGCPVRWKDLRYLRMTYVDFGGNARTGEMVVNKTFAEAVTNVFARLYETRWPIARMRLVDDYRGIDRRSMAANNTSSYNCRHVAGTREWSAHAYGAAIDINPVQNPYVTESSTAPAAGRRFAAIDRSAGAHVPPGAIRAGDVVVRAFARIGWEWGGDWVTTKDFQHFSADEV
jgi:poly-gamma-glutamate synthesis protein (capsule biosynthesis protein)